MVRTKLRPPPSGIGLGAKLWWRRYYKGPFSDWSKRPSTGPGPPASNGLPGPDQVMNSTLVSETRRRVVGQRHLGGVQKKLSDPVGRPRAPSRKGLEHDPQLRQDARETSKKTRGRASNGTSKRSGEKCGKACFWWAPASVSSSDREAVGAHTSSWSPRCAKSPAAPKSATRSNSSKTQPRTKRRRPRRRDESLPGHSRRQPRHSAHPYTPVLRRPSRPAVQHRRRPERRDRRRPPRTGRAPRRHGTKGRRAT